MNLMWWIKTGLALYIGIGLFIMYLNTKKMDKQNQIDLNSKSSDDTTTYIER